MFRTDMVTSNCFRALTLVVLTSEQAVSRKDMYYAMDHTYTPQVLEW